jgi:hypothetical protein
VGELRVRPLPAAAAAIPYRAADDERRELTGVPDELAFTAKPQLAAAMLERAREAGHAGPLGGRRRGLQRA